MQVKSTIPQLSICQKISIGLALIGFSVSFAAFFPGWLSRDSVIQYSEALADNYDAWQPVLMAWWWGKLNHIHSGPAIFLVQDLLIYWSALGLVAVVTYPCLGGWSVAIALIGAVPSAIFVMGQIWKDVFFTSLVMLATALILQGKMVGKFTWLRRSAILALLVMAVGSKTNGLIAVVVVMAYWFHSEPRFKGKIALQLASVTCTATIALFAPRLLISKDRIQQASPIQYIQSYDLLAISVATNRLLLPDYIVRKTGISAENARSFFWPGSNNLLFYNTKAGNIRSFDNAQIADLQARWLNTIEENPWLYLSVRMESFSSLLRLCESEAAWVAVPESIPNEWRFSANRNIITNLLETTTRAQPWLYFPWIYIAITALALFSTPRLPEKIQSFNVTLSVSSLAFVAPHFFVAPASDYRYLHYVTLCALIQLAMGVPALIRRHR